MKKYLFEEIPLSVPSDLLEMKSVFAQMLEDSGQSVISFINPEIFLAQEKIRFYTNILRAQNTIL